MFLHFLRSIKTLIAIYLLIVAFFVYEGIVNYHEEKSYEISEKSKNLSSIAELKEESIINWYRERLADSYFLYKNKLIHQTLAKFIKSGKKSDSAAFLSSVHSLYQNHDYSNLFVADKNQRVIISINKSGSTEFIKDSLLESISRDSVLFSDIYNDPVVNSPCLDIYIPIQENQKYLCTIILKVEPKKLLYPTISSWFDPLSSGECYIVNIHDGKVKYLSPLKFQEENNLRPDRILKKDEMSVYKSDTGNTGFIINRDYRGEKVLAFARSLKLCRGF